MKGKCLGEMYTVFTRFSKKFYDMAHKVYKSIGFLGVISGLLG